MRWDPNPKIKDKLIKKNWDVSKSPAANLEEMGLVARPNQLPKDDQEPEQAAAAAKAHIIELFDVPDSDRPSRATRFPLTKDEESYMAKCMAKHGDNVSPEPLRRFSLISFDLL